MRRRGNNAALPHRRLADMPTCRLADLPTRRRADLPTCRHADMPTCRPLNADAVRRRSSNRRPGRNSALIRPPRQCQTRTLTTSWTAWSIRSAGTWSPSNGWSGPGSRCPSRTSHNETRRSAYGDPSASSQGVQLVGTSARRRIGPGTPGSSRAHPSLTRHVPSAQWPRGRLFSGCGSLRPHPAGRRRGVVLWPGRNPCPNSGRLDTLHQRAEAKDRLDVYALLKSGISLADGLRLARQVCGPDFNTLPPLQALCYFQKPSLRDLPELIQTRLVQAVQSVH